MGLEDIVYNEAKNLLLKHKKKDEVKKEAKILLKKTLRRFMIDWQQFIDSKPVRFYVESEYFYTRYRETLLSLFVELEDFLEEPIKEKLLNITDMLQKGQKTIPALGLRAYNERKKFGDSSVEEAKEIIKIIGDFDG